MPILLVLFLIGTCAPIAWPPPPFDLGARAATTIMLVALLLPLVAHYALVHWVVGKLTWQPQQRGFLAEKYSRLRRLIGWAHLALSLAAIALGWGWVVNERFQPAPFAELLVPLPYLVGVFVSWILHYDAERALHLATMGPRAAFWSRSGHFLYRLRPYSLLVMFHAVLFAGQQTLLRYFPETAGSQEMQWVLLALAPLLFVLMPLIAKPVLGFKSLPRGHHRDRLEATARRLQFRCTDLLIWPTHGTLANALVLGLLPRARYVVFTDRLLDELDDDELDAVFGHEIGHVLHGHLLHYAIFFILSMVLIFAAFGELTIFALKKQVITEEEYRSAWLSLPPLAIFAAYLFLVFGFLSRKCERQADLFGVRTVAGNRTEGHPQAAGVNAMMRALDKVALLNGLENSFGDGSTSGIKRLRQRLVSWQHGSIADRLEFLRRTLEEEELEARMQWRINAFRWLTLAALVAGLVALGSWFGWKHLAEML